MSESHLPPLKLKADCVELSVVKSGEWEICINLSNGDSLYHYTERPDAMADQLNMDIDVQSVELVDDE